jgi:hypothetical protein
MTDSTMVEKVARAIYEKRYAGAGVSKWDTCKERASRDGYDYAKKACSETMDEARAAIEAFSVLTPSMLRAGLTAMSRDDLEPTEAEFAAGYTAAIRDALGETFGKGDGE